MHQPHDPAPLRWALIGRFYRTRLITMVIPENRLPYALRFGFVIVARDSDFA